MADNSAHTPRPNSRPRWLILFGIIIVAGIVLISCATVTRTVVAPPEIPGAEFAGSKTCAECHENINRDFPTATHAKLEIPGRNAMNMGCEACHGPGAPTTNPARRRT